MPDWTRILSGGLGCFLLAWLPLALEAEGAPLWLVNALLIFLTLDRSGRSLAVILAAGGIGVLLAHLAASGGFPVSVLSIAFASVLHAALARYLVLRLAPESLRLERAGDLARLLLWSALLSPVPGAAVVGGLALAGPGLLPPAQAFVSWWSVSAVGTAILLPFLLSLRRAPAESRLLPSRWREALMVLALVLLVAVLARQAIAGFPSLLGLPLVLWAALRLDFRTTSLLCVLVAWLPVAGAAANLWPLDGEGLVAVAPAEQRQAYLLAIILPALFASLFTEQQRVGDRARRAALRALRAVMDTVPLAIVASKPDGTVRLWSRGAERVFGWRRSEVEGMEPPFVAPEHAAQDASLHQRVLAGNEIQNQPAQRRDKEGMPRDLVVNAAPQRDPDGTITGLISVMEDVTDRRRLEASREDQRARLAAILDAVADPIITIDESGTITSFSRAAEAVFGYPAAEIIGRNLKILMLEPDHGRHDAYLRRYRETGVKRMIGTNRRVTARRRDGSTFPADVAISEAWMDGKRIFAGLVRDLSAKPTAIQAQGQDQPTDGDSAKFLSRIAHDLRQPLHALSLLTGALERRVEDPGAREIVEDLSRIVRSTQATFENLVEWTRLERGLIGVATAEVEAADILQSLAQEFAPEAARRNLAFRFVASRATIACDPALLRRILRQLLDNAVKFTASGKILLGARRHGPLLRLIVADTGAGIPADQLDSIFVAYHQLDTGREAGGLGLGLAIAQRLSARAGLAIGFQSLPGRGSLFWLDVPLSAG